MNSFSIGLLFAVQQLCLGTMLAQDLAGIGVVLGKEDGRIVVKRVLPGYPAALSGLVGTNDAVLAVAETTDVAEVAKRIRGPQGSKVFLTLGPKDNFESQSRVIRLVRDAIKELEPEAQNLLRAPDLQTGKKAPDIAGKDIDGRDFTLSAYREKVVLLCFWGHWCGPCRLLYPRERELSQTFSNEPFLIVGVNSDSKKEVVKEVVKTERLTWPILWDEEQRIQKNWGINAWPSVFLIDQGGTIRFKSVGIPEKEALDSQIKTLLSRGEKKGDMLPSGQSRRP